MGTIAANIVDTLKASGVKRVYGLPGDSLNGFTDALRADGDLQWVHVRHEEGAAFAASAEAALTGELTVCAASCGPGNTHLVNGLYDANRSRVPVLAIAAHIPSAEIGSNYFQETHPQELFRECSVYCELVSDPAQMPRVLEIAMRTAIEKKGVAVIVIPGDILLKKADSPRTVSIRPTQSSVLPSAEGLAEAAALLNKGEKVTILAGAGAAGAHAELLALADTLGAPIVHALRGKEHVEYDNPFDVGMTGLLGFASGYRAMETCDTLLVLGSEFPYQQFFPEKAVKIQVDVRGEQLGRRTPLTLGLVGTVKDTAAALTNLVERKKKRSHLEDALKHYKKSRKGLDDLADNDHNRSPIHPQYLTRLIDELASDDAVFIPDVGSPVTWAARYLHMNGKRRLIGSFSHGTMANAVSQGLGAQASHPDRQIIALAGDGGLTMLMGELLSLVQNKLPVKIVVFNNSTLGLVKLEMLVDGYPDFGVDVPYVDYAAVARSIGIHAVHVDQPGDLRDGFEAVFEHDGPALIDIATDPQALSLPPAITGAQVKGFSLAMSKIVMNGGAGEVVSMARSNLRNVPRP